MCGPAISPGGDAGPLPYSYYDPFASPPIVKIAVVCPYMMERIGH